MTDTLLHAADELARLLGATALRRYRSALNVETKSDGSPVTLADREAESAARTWLARHFPADGIIGEEFGSQPGSSGRQWILDPIDGTKSFIRGVPLWGSLVACVEDERVLAGAAAFPATNEFLSAAPGLGCWLNGTRTRTSSIASLDSATVLTTDARAFRDAKGQDAWTTLATKAGVAREWGDCFGYLLVASGRAEVMVDARVSPWDIACFLPIVEEAGGCFTDLRGKRTAFGESAIATNAPLASIAREHFG
jgi:histidinol-phosphatase